MAVQMTIPPTKRIRDRVAIVGFADGHAHLAPYDDDTWETWGINTLHKRFGDKRWTRWFNLHDLEKHHGDDQEHLKWLREFKGPVYLRPEDVGKYKILGESFPKGTILRKFRPYFNNTISWLTAFAIHLGYKEIGMWGVDMAQDGILMAEFSHQRPSCEYFLGLAEGMGIKITVAPESDLLKTTHLYGFEDGDQWSVKLTSRLQEVAGRKEDAKRELGELDNRRAQVIAAINQLDGAMQDTQYYLRTWSPMK